MPPRGNAKLGTGADAVVAKLPHRQLFGWSIGGFAFNLFFQTAGLLLLFYYTDILGLSPATAGWVFAGALVWDAIFDPLMGFLANRTRTRWGKYRPYILFGAIPLALSWMLMFLPTGLTGGPLIAFAVLAHIAFRSCYAIVNMPFLAMSAAITTDSQQRGVLSAFHMAASMAGALFTALATLKFVGAFGGDQTGFFWTAVLYGTAATAVLFVVFFATSERAAPVDEALPSFADMARMLKANRVFWIVCAAMLLGQVGGTFFQKTLPYYMKYALHREDLISAALGILAGTAMVSIPLWMWVMRRWSKQVMWIAGTGLATAGLVLLWIVRDQPMPTLLALVPIGIGASSSYIGFWAMMPDTVEYGEWRSGVRAEGAVFGLVSLIQKASLGFAAALLGELLAVIGYRPNVAQTAETLGTMGVLMIMVPAATGVLAGIVIGFYPLDKRMHGRLVRILVRRTTRATAVVMAAP